MPVAPMDVATPEERRAEMDAPGAPHTTGTAAATDDAVGRPEAPYVVLSGLSNARYNGRIGQILFAVTDAMGVDRWAVRLSATEKIRVPVDKCTRVTESEIVQWELDGRRGARRAELAARGEVEDPEVAKAEVDTRPFPPPLHAYVFEMDNFYREHLTTGEDVRVHEFATLFDHFEMETCKAVASDVGDANVTEDSARKALDSHMSRSARYEAAFNRYVRLVEYGAGALPFEDVGSTEEVGPTEDVGPTEEAADDTELVAMSVAKATLDDGQDTTSPPSAPSSPRPLGGCPSPVHEEGGGLLE